ncbi:hypothetical protein LJC34_05855 [Oscillospiraceae bacterium OttesenSCG-928-G22]|nr:hypothetical protein [Oscillospiraceae bacterium OttesenSCG-928-G22]
MIQSHSDIIACAQAQADKLSAIATANIDTCRKWTDGKCDNLQAAYDYLFQHDPGELKKFISALKCQVDMGDHLLQF